MRRSSKGSTRGRTTTLANPAISRCSRPGCARNCAESSSKTSTGRSVKNSCAKISRPPRPGPTGRSPWRIGRVLFRPLKARLRAQLRRKQFEDEYGAIREELLRKDIEAAEARADREIALARAALVDELEQKNLELEAFTYAVSHDLRSPLRTIRGFSQALLDDFAGQLPAGAAGQLDRIQAAAVRMGHLIDALLE